MASMADSGWSGAGGGAGDGRFTTRFWRRGAVEVHGDRHRHDRQAFVVGYGTPLTTT